MRFGLVVSQWNSDITSSMSQAAQATLIQAGASEEDIITQQVPGSFELIYGCSRMMEKRSDPGCHHCHWQCDPRRNSTF